MKIISCLEPLKDLTMDPALHKQFPVIWWFSRPVTLTLLLGTKEIILKSLPLTQDSFQPPSAEGD